MRDGIREKELSDLGIEATVEHLDKGRVRIDVDLVAFDDLVGFADFRDAHRDGYAEGCESMGVAMGALEDHRDHLANLLRDARRKLKAAGSSAALLADIDSALAPLKPKVAS